MGGGQPPRAQMPVPSVGEDRAILLGFGMMAFSVLMLFVVGVTTVKPYLGRYRREVRFVQPTEEAGSIRVGLGDRRMS